MFHATTLRFALFLSAVGLSACGSDEPAEVEGELEWRVVCGAAEGCVDGLPHTIQELNGKAGHRIGCSLSSLGADAYELSFSASNSFGNYGIGLEDAAFSASGGAVTGQGCRVNLEESGNRYEGVCGPNVPTDGVPCQVTDIGFTEAKDGPQVSGQILCRGIPLAAAPLDRNRARDIVAPTGNVAMSFVFTNCSGF